MTITPEMRFCAKYLLEHGVTAKNFSQVVLSLSSSDPRFEFVKVKKVVKDKTFFKDLAKKLRPMWPTGSKDGKYEWRCSEKVLAERLEFLWSDRLKGKTFTVEECLMVARRYLSRYETDTKFMQTLKYFVFKQKDVIMSDGKIKHQVESKFADMLEGKADEDAVQNEWESLMSSSAFGEGELV